MMAILPELVLLCGATFYFIVSLLPSPGVRLLRGSSIFIGLLVFASACLTYGQESTLFHNAYVVDNYTQMFKVLIGFALAVVMIFGVELRGIENSVRAEYSMFLYLSVLGLMMLVSSVELIAIFISLELSSFALYVMVPMRDDSTGTRTQMEAGIKYVLFGVMATGFMLFGMSYLFGLTGSTYLQDIIPALQGLGGQPAVVVSVIMILAGFFYKLAVFPMHFWVPDVYEGASNETTGFIATVPKLGAVALLIRLMTLPSGQPEFLVQFLGGVAVCSMFYGNLCALVQKDIKRMLGYSGISHAGFVVLGLLSLRAEGYGLAIYYIAGYVIMNLACFLVISALSQRGENLQIDDFNGLYKRQPVLAFILSVSLFALAGIPPFVGFMGKFFLLTSTLQQDHLIIVILAAINTAIAIYYYLSVVKAAYTTDSNDEQPAILVPPMTRITGLVLVVMIILMGTLPSKFVNFAGSLVQSIM
ncbi:NADH-quinone oxidoreductase subunit N [Desulfogranum japonicum]|uniref:NADH-quinone oxidoreductase subunit N n=1 Tax=Desulfogranum japonicum TaxID=231447 RepID=UPI0004039840|nr:NADH-quinone oxidoreductase subunit N [Desulfogranum japonicum]